MTTTKQYDYLNRLLSISSSPSSSSSLPISYAYAYNDANQRTRVALNDGSFCVYQYDALGQVISGKKYWSDGTPIPGQQFEYGFDDVGNRTSTKAGGDQSGAGLRPASYAANSLNQYTNRTVPGAFDVIGIANASASVTVNSSAADYRRGEYFQELAGLNNSSTSVWQSVTVTTSGGGTNTGNIFVPTATESYGYDADGNMTNDGRWTFTWDAENRLVSMQALSSVPSGAKKKLDFTYDYQGRRIQKIVSTWNGSAYVAASTNKFLYDAWNLLAELNSTNGVIRSYLWGLDLSGQAPLLGGAGGGLQGAGGVGGLLAIKPTGTNTLFVAYDGNGNVTGLIDAATGTTSGQFEYGPFGETTRLALNANNQSPFRFSTKYADDESDFLYYGYRYYNPSTGSWLSRDAIGEQGGDNLYAFVRNDSLDSVDAIGMQSWSFPGSLPKPTPPPGYPGTVVGDLALLNDKVQHWRAIGWGFAAGNLAHFVANTGTHLNVFQHHKKVANNRDWRVTAWKYFEALSKTAQSGRVGDMQLANVSEGSAVANPAGLTQYFHHTFGSAAKEVFVESDELFFALYHSHYDFYGRLCKGRSSWSVDVKIALVDQLTFPSDRFGFRNIVNAYAAANDLELRRGWSGLSWVYAVWDDHFDSGRKP